MTAARLLQASPAPLFPFGEPASRLPLLDVSLRDHQDRELYRAGLGRAVDVGPGDAIPVGVTVAFREDTAFTADTLIALLEETRDGSLRQVAVPPGTALFDFVAPLHHTARQAEPFPCGLFGGALGGLGRDREDRLGAAPLAPLCDEADSEEHLVAPAGPAPHLLRVPRCRRLAGRVSHWLHLLNLNHALLVAERERLGATSGRNHWEGRAAIHPTALVEDSIIASRVVIEQGASVMRCFLGEGVHVADHAVLADCVIGPGSHTLVDTHLRRVVAMGGSTLSNLGTSDLLLGREVFLTTGVAFFGGEPGRTVVVDGADTRRPVLGGCVGHKVTLGARALFAAGVAVPSGTVVVGRPDEAAQKLDERGLARAHMRFGDPRTDA